MNGVELECGCTLEHRCEEAERLWLRLRGIWDGLGPGQEDMFTSLRAPQRQRCMEVNASLEYHEHRRGLEHPAVFKVLAEAACRLYVAPPPRRSPVGDYGPGARAVMQLEILEGLAAGLPLSEAVDRVTNGADKRTCYHWMAHDEAFAGAVNQLRGVK